MRVVFLLGAGVSFDLLPLSRELTEMVRTAKAPDGREVHRFSDSTYGLANPFEGDNLGQEHVRRVTAFLDWLANRLPQKSRDYEALFFACRQIHDALTDEMENALLEPFLAECERQVLALPPRPLGHGSNPEELSQEALNYIGAIVLDALSPSRQHPIDAGRLKQGYRPLLDACGDAEVDRLDLVTLNHDTLLEKGLRDAGATVEDGFHRAKTGWRMFNGRRARVQFWRGFRGRTRGRVRLVKLHGSIDWWRLRPVGGDWSDETVARADSYPQRLRDATGAEWETPENSPVMLVGTFNKILDYTRPFHLQQYAVMRRALLMSDALVIAGYSFRDKAVNGMITDWYYAKARSSRPLVSRPLVVIGPDCCSEEAPETARGAIANKWAGWHKGRRMTVMTARFSDTEWDSIKRRLAPN
jgi:hypothetical protein